MSAEVSLLAVLWKPVAWVFGGLLAILSTLVGLLWKDHKKSVEDNKQSINGVSDKLDKDYYTREHIDLILHPVHTSLDKNTEAIDKLQVTLAEVNVTLAKNK